MSNRKSDDAREIAYERRIASKIRTDARHYAREGKRAERIAFGGAR